MCGGALQSSSIIQTQCSAFTTRTGNSCAVAVNLLTVGEVILKQDIEPGAVRDGRVHIRDAVGMRCVGAPHTPVLQRARIRAIPKGVADVVVAEFNVASMQPVHTGPKGLVLAVPDHNSSNQTEQQSQKA